ncbi:MAG: hypothetical protein ACRDWD_04510, partial [Acidimicrobiia bacterium]
MTGSRYQNCFYYYRGPSKGQSEADLAQQVEDNSTKVLINVLEYSEPDLASSFLREVLGTTIDADQGSAQFFLQGGPKSPAARRLLIGLSVAGTIHPGSWRHKEQGSRVDAAIHRPGALTVLIETKVVDALDGAQLQRHAKKWRLPTARADRGPASVPEQWKLITWASVYEWARQQAARRSGEPTRFLLGQLSQYMELSGLAPTWRLRDEHFQYFDPESGERDPAVKQEIKVRLESMWKAVEARIGSEAFQASLGEVRVGNVGAKDDHAWAQSHVGPACWENANITIELRANEISVNIVGWFKHQGERVERWLLGDSGRAFVNANPGYDLVVFVITGKGEEKVLWQGATGKELTRLRLSAEALDSLPEKLSTWRDGLDE